jgi:rhodanese-related sulfurtransferase
MKEKGVVLVDVLSSESYAKGHIKGAISIPLNELEKKIGTLNKADKIIVYCASKKCQASVKAAKLLIKHGFKNVYDYKSGLKEWIESGLPISAKKDK